MAKDLSRQHAAEPAAVRPAKKQHFVALDGLRGVAAISVMLYHYTGTEGAWFPQGYLAVDLFFLLSGFVIAFSYEEKLRAGLSPGSFMIRRLIRLYPMIVAASVLGVLATYAKLSAQPAGRDLTSLLGLLLYSLTLIPQLHDTYLGKEIFPLNVVLWTLFFEVFANLVYCLGACRLKTKPMLAIVLGCLALLAMSGPLGGNLTDNVLLGFPRVAVGFFAGVLLYRCRWDGQSKWWNYGFVPLSAVMILTFWLPVSPQGVTLIAVFGLFALIVLVGAAAAPSRFVSRVSRGLGDMSYPLYALHLPLHSFLTPVERKLMLGKFIPSAGLEVFTSLCVIALSAAVLKVFDEPVRRFLSRRLARTARTRLARPLQL